MVAQHTMLQHPELAATPDAEMHRLSVHIKGVSTCSNINAADTQGSNSGDSQLPCGPL